MSTTGGNGDGNDPVPGEHEVPFWHHDLLPEPAPPAATDPATMGAPLHPDGPATWDPQPAGPHAAAGLPPTAPPPPAADAGWGAPAAPAPPLHHDWDAPAAPPPPLDHAWDAPTAQPAATPWGPPAAAPPPPPPPTAIPWGAPAAGPPPPPPPGSAWGTGGWIAPPPMAPTPPERSRMGTPVIVAVLAVVALIGAMVFVVATHDDAKPRSSAAGSDLVDSGSDGSGSLADSIDAEALTAQLKSFVPDTVDLAGIKGISREGARWQVVDEQTIPPSDTVPDCAPDVKPAQGGFGRQWGLGDADGHIHGQLVVTIVKYDTPADASAAVEARGAKAYEACYLAQREDELRETAGTDDVDPVVVTKKVAEASPSAALTRISTSEGFRVRGQACVHYIDASWRQVGARVIATDFSTCLNPFDPKAELQVEAAIAGQMQG